MTPNDRKYTKTHEWIKVEGDVALVGITDYAQDAMGDITFIELPAVDRAVEQNEECGVIESVKVASDICAPVAGEITATNSALDDKPELVNEAPYGEGWILKLRNLDAGQLDSLMDAAQYEAMLETQE